MRTGGASEVRKALPVAPKQKSNSIKFAWQPFPQRYQAIESLPCTLKNSRSQPCDRLIQNQFYHHFLMVISKIDS